MSGPLPAELTSLGRLERLLAGGTGLCAPADPAFAAWLDGVHTRRVAPCAEREARGGVPGAGGAVARVPGPAGRGRAGAAARVPDGGAGRGRRRPGGSGAVLRRRPGDARRVRSQGVRSDPDQSRRGLPRHVGQRRDSGERGAARPRDGRRGRPGRDARPRAGRRAADPRDRAAGGRRAGPATTRSDGRSVPVGAGPGLLDPGRGPGDGGEPGGRHAARGRARAAPGGRARGDGARARAELEQRRPPPARGDGGDPRAGGREPATTWARWRAR